VEHLKEIPGTLEFYMGKNTPERKNYIMENLDRIEDEILEK
jgi:topoisomerase IV subunit B